MKIKIRRSSKKARKMTGFLKRKKSKGAKKWLKVRRTGKKLR